MIVLSRRGGYTVICAEQTRILNYVAVQLVYGGRKDLLNKRGRNDVQTRVQAGK